MQANACVYDASFSFHRSVQFTESQYVKELLVPPFLELFVSSFGDKAQDNQDSHLSRDSGEKEKQHNSLHFSKVVYIRKAIK